MTWLVAHHRAVAFSVSVAVCDLRLRFRWLPGAAESGCARRGGAEPVGQWLLTLGNGHVWYLLAAKFLGTVVAATLVLLINQSRPRWGLPIVAAVAASQLGLLLFLLLA